MPSVETSRSDSILTVTINRPEARNAVVCVRTGFRAMSNGGSPPKRPYATNTGVAWRCSAAAKLRRASGNSGMVQGARVGRVKRGREAYYFVSGLTATSLENDVVVAVIPEADVAFQRTRRSEEHTSELQSLRHLVCRL